MISLLIASILVTAGPNLGFGVGQTLGDHLLTPSLFTMRIPAGKSFIIAPELNVKYTRHEDDIDSTKDSDFDVGVETNFHRAFWKGERTGLYGIFGVGVELFGATSEYYEHPYPDSLSKIEETLTRRVYGLNLGLGIEHFFRERLSLCISSLSNMTLESEKRERDQDGQTEVLYDRSGYTFDFQNLRCNIYLVWYL